VPIKFITFGEKYLEIDRFDSNRIARRILGLDDIVGIVEKASKSISLDKISDIESKIKNDTFDLNDFRTQLDQMNNMGSLSSLVKLLPNMKKISNLNVNEKNVISTKAMLDSMTNYERENPDIINGSRRKRIALGSGTSMQKVNQLLKQFKQMKVLMKKMKNKKFGKLPF
jgi:signal recognition particle subunit SRP54